MGGSNGVSNTPSDPAGIWAEVLGPYRITHREAGSVKHKTAELEGALLDAAVAKAEGWVRWVNGVADPVTHLHFSTDWAEGAPIIERELIDIWHSMLGTAHPVSWHAEATGKSGMYSAAAPLIAAMRAFVASKFGGEVELP